MKNIFTRIFVLAALIIGVTNTIDAQISTEPVNDTICFGEDAVFFVEVNNSADTSFQWQSLKESNWIDIVDNEVYSGIENDTLQIISPPTGFNDSSYRCIVVQGINNYTSDTVGVVVNEVPDIPTLVTAQPAGICEGDSSSLLATCSSIILNWYVDSCGSQEPISNGSPYVVYPSTTTIYYVTCENEFCESACENVQVTVSENVPVSISIIANTGNIICEGTEVIFTATPENGGGAPSCQWMLNGNPVGSNISTYSTDTLLNNDEISCELTSSMACTSNNPALSNTIAVTVYDLLVPTIINEDTSICFNTIPNTLYSNVIGGASNHTYLWESSTDGGSNWITESIDTNLIFVNELSNTTEYRLTINDGDTCGPVTTDTLLITVYDQLSAVIDSAQSICFNTTPDILTSTVIGGYETYTYQWQVLNGSSWSDIPGEINSTYQPGLLDLSTDYRLIVNDGANCGPFITDSLTITVYDEFLADIDPEQNICFNTIPETLTSTTIGGDETYTYQWQVFDGSSWSDIPGGINPTYQPGSLTVTTVYQLIVHDGANCGPITSNSLNILVYGELFSQIGSDTTICQYTAPDILTSITSGGDETYTYQWQDSPDGNSWTDIPGATSENYQPPPLDASTYYQLKVNDESCNPVITNFVTIMVNPSVTASISISASKNPTCDNEEVIFSISDSLNGGNEPGFEWFLNGESTSMETSWSSLVNDSDEVYVQMNSKAECVNNNPANSDVITMMVNASPFLLNSGDLIPKPINNPAVLICVDSLETNTYRWFVNDEEIQMANEKFFYPPKYDLTFSYNSEYHVMVENEFCTSNSNPYTYTINKSALFEKSEVFIVYPNPNNGNFSIALNEEVVPEDFELCTVRIFDLTGKIVFREEIFEMAQNIDLLDVQKGLYFLEVRISETQYQVRKLIIE